MSDPHSESYKAHLLAFGLLVFVVVLVSLSVLQIVGLGEYGGFVAGVLAALAAMFGGTILFNRPKRP
jgi:hypothetical protein